MIEFLAEWIFYLFFTIWILVFTYFQIKRENGKISLESFRSKQRYLSLFLIIPLFLLGIFGFVNGVENLTFKVGFEKDNFFVVDYINNPFLFIFFEAFLFLSLLTLFFLIKQRTFGWKKYVHMLKTYEVGKREKLSEKRGRHHMLYFTFVFSLMLLLFKYSIPYFGFFNSLIFFLVIFPFAIFVFSRNFLKFKKSLIKGFKFSIKWIKDNW